MSAWPEPASYFDPRPKTMRFCRTCGKETPHQIRCGPGLSALICISCLERALAFELDRGD